ncbi:hypothetical protein [Planomicrobium sp. MB-3u-38]|uniref:hypothetical protein n=1 Tax=Planomicrobium sp. MB-3u-38 TaxID=2058318 RepID=UPI000C7CD1AA|nr:hypothetical protein [Planomicrobium sp. MB-3u-38]PKH12262.1 hypothetical protein CXF70_01810 [Planomicrobium sp. MB-3u-38]
MQKQTEPPKNIGYYLSRVKDIHVEEGQTIITLFARLSIKTPERNQNVWVEIEEVAWHQASRQIQQLPNGAYYFQLSEPVFREMERVSKEQLKTLYHFTPLYESVTFKKLG